MSHVYFYLMNWYHVIEVKIYFNQNIDYLNPPLLCSIQYQQHMICSEAAANKGMEGPRYPETPRKWGPKDDHRTSWILDMIPCEGDVNQVASHSV